jgi:CBS domain containing-hemolysin-like protein
MMTEFDMDPLLKACTEVENLNEKQMELIKKILELEERHFGREMVRRKEIEKLVEVFAIECEGKNNDETTAV